MSANFNIESGKTSSKVLRPPGGGSSDIFGASGSGPELSTPRNTKNRMASNIFASEQNAAVKNNGDSIRRGQKNTDSYSRLFGEPSRPFTPAKNHMKSSIPINNSAMINGEIDCTDGGKKINGHQNGHQSNGFVSKNANPNGFGSKNAKHENGASNDSTNGSENHHNGNAISKSEHQDIQENVDLENVNSDSVNNTEKIVENFGEELSPNNLQQSENKISDDSNNTSSTDDDNNIINLDNNKNETNLNENNDSETLNINSNQLDGGASTVTTPRSPTSGDINNFDKIKEEVNSIELKTRKINNDGGDHNIHNGGGSEFNSDTLTTTTTSITSTLTSTDPTPNSSPSISHKKTYLNNPNRSPRDHAPRNPVTGLGVQATGFKPRRWANHKDGNPITGEGYNRSNGTTFAAPEINTSIPALNGANQVINKNRVPPGGYSSGLW